MKKIILGVLIGAILAISGITLASMLNPDIEGADSAGWISIGNPDNNYTSVSYVKRIYDKDNDVYCWIWTYRGGGGIDCFEVKH